MPPPTEREVALQALVVKLTETLGASLTFAESLARTFSETLEVLKETNAIRPDMAQRCQAILEDAEQKMRATRRSILGGGDASDGVLHS